MDINSDQLGAKGQARFTEWCEDAGLIANRSERDRAGWDYLVDFPLPATVGTFDKRPPALVCLVQVKTILATTTDVELRLDMAERLAKDVRPSFVVIPVVNSDLTFKEVRVLHIAGRHVERILKRLRKASVEGRLLSDLTISFAISKAPALPTSGEAIKDAFRTACPDGMAAYTRKKEEHREIAGFKPNAYQARMTLKAADAEAVFDALLGFRKQLPLESLHVTETRFDITVDHETINGGLASFQPAPARKGQMRLFADGDVRPLTQPVELFELPFDTGSIRKWRFVGPNVSVLLTHDVPAGRIQGVIAPVESEASMPLQAWRDRCAWGLAVSRGNYTLEFEVDGRPTLRLPEGRSSKTVDIDAMTATLAVLDALVDVTSRAGEDPTRELSETEIIYAFRHAGRLTALVDGEVFAFVPRQAVPRFEPFPVLLGGALRLGARDIAWSGKALIEPAEGDDPRLPMRGFILGRVRSVRGKGEFDAFCAEMASREGNLQFLVFGEVPHDYGDTEDEADDVELGDAT